MENVKFSEQEFVKIFQVEELEKRYEMGWVGSIAGTIHYETTDEIIDPIHIEVY